MHTRPGGAAIFCPDHVRERFRETTDHGGHDGKDGDPRSLRYLQWTWDPDPDDTWYVDDMAYLLREGADEPRVVHDRHVLGLFPRDTWLSLLADAGFDAADRGPPPGSRMETRPVPRYSWRPDPSEPGEATSRKPSRRRAALGCRPCRWSRFERR